MNPEDKLADAAYTNARATLDAAEKVAAAIKTGDVVLHRPSGEKWLVAYAEHGYICACGWPETLANESDCQLLISATEEERFALLRQMADKQGHDTRWRYARRALGLPLALLLCALALPAAPITTTPGEPCATGPCQPWYTASIPTDGGVYPLEVYAPSLPRLWPGPPILELGEPPRLEPPNMETPEPGTGWIVLAYLGVGRACQWCYRRKATKQLGNGDGFRVCCNKCLKRARKALEEEK